MRGAPLDDYGRNVYVETLNSAYGPGWKRENGFLAQRPAGNFCYGFFPGQAGLGRGGGGLPGHGDRPGVTPDVMWQGSAPGSYDRALDAQANEQRALAGASGLCRPN